MRLDLHRRAHHGANFTARRAETPNAPCDRCGKRPWVAHLSELAVCHPCYTWTKRQTDPGYGRGRRRYRPRRFTDPARELCRAEMTKRGLSARRRPAMPPAWSVAWWPFERAIATVLGDDAIAYRTRERGAE